MLCKRYYPNLRAPIFVISTTAFGYKGCFAPPKRVYRGMIEAKVRYDINYIDKLDFLVAFSKARKEAFKPATIQNLFSVASLDYIILNGLFQSSTFIFGHLSPKEVH